MSDSFNATAAVFAAGERERPLGFLGNRSRAGLLAEAVAVPADAGVVRAGPLSRPTGRVRRAHRAPHLKQMRVITGQV